MDKLKHQNTTRQCSFTDNHQPQAVPIDGDGQVLREGDRVYSYDYNVETAAPHF